MKKKWWYDSVIYQIYPRSFQDSNGDGVGDLKGIIQRLDYLKKLGIDGIWLSPVYKSPNDDNGYDISNYEEIMSEFGEMDDMDNLISEAKKRNIKIIMDLVVNHTSDEHAWFVESKKGKNNKYRDYYIWRDPIGGEVPNNLRSTFSGPAWELDSDTGQYYLHLFSKKQPDLNWENSQVRNEIYDMINFWIRKGVGGFRLDVIDLIGKVPDLEITGNGPKLHDYLKEMNTKTFRDKDLMTVGETWGITPEIAKMYSDPSRNELSMVFQFDHIGIDQQQGKEKWDIKPMSVSELKQIFSKWQTSIGEDGWNSLFWNNHDQPRIVSRWGNEGRYHKQSAKLFAILLHLMKGTPYIYQGEEIGMTNCPISDITEANDIETVNMYNERISKGYQKEEVINSINAKGRDNARTPMQWDESKFSGFSSVEPWLHVNPNYKSINVNSQLCDPDSIFYTYKKLISLRKCNKLIVWGIFELVEKTDDNIFAYFRKFQGETWLVVANISDMSKKFTMPIDSEKIIISNYTLRSLPKGNMILRPYEAYAVILKGKKG